MVAFVPTSRAYWLLHNRWNQPADDGHIPRTLDQIIPDFGALTLTFEDDFDDVDTTVVDATSGTNPVGTLTGGAKWGAPGRSTVGAATHLLKTATPPTVFQGNPSELVLRIYNNAGYGGGGPWSSGHIQSMVKTGLTDYEGFSQQYGVFQYRVKLPPAAGVGRNNCWAGGWTKSRSEYDRLWIGDTEFDISETYGDNEQEQTRAHCTIFKHPAGYRLPGDHTGDLLTGTNVGGNYNGVVSLAEWPQYYPHFNQYDGNWKVYTMVWKPADSYGPAEIIMLYQGHPDDPHREVVNFPIGDFMEMHYPAYMLLSNQLLATGTDVRSPMDMVIDWARVYQKPAWAAAIQPLELVQPAGPAVQAQIDIYKAEGFWREKWNLTALPNDHPYKDGVNGSPPPMSPAVQIFQIGPTPPDGWELGTVAPLNLPLNAVSPLFSDSTGRFSYSSATGKLIIPDGSLFTQTDFQTLHEDLIFYQADRATATDVRVVARPTLDWLPTDANQGISVVGWFSADRMSTVFKDSNGRVGQWGDQSRYNRDLTVSASTFKPTWVANALNGKPGIRSTISPASRLDFPVGSPPFSRDGLGPTHNIIGSNQLNFYTGGSNRVFGTYDGTPPHVLVILCSTASIHAYKNGVEVPYAGSMTGIKSKIACFYVIQLFSNGQSGSGRVLYLSETTDGTNHILNAATEGSRAMDGYLYEAIFYSGAITPGSALHRKFEGYLAWHWGLQGDLPADHPWKAAAPQYTD